MLHSIFLIFALLFASPVAYGVQLSADVSWTNNWTQDNPATSNILKRGPHGGPLAQIAEVGPSDNKYIDQAIVSGVAYDWQVFALNSAGPSDPSNIACSTFTQGFPPIRTLPFSISALTNFTPPSVGIVGVSYKIDGVSLGAQITTPPFTLSFSPATYTNGSHLVSTTVSNSDGTIVVHEDQVTIANTDPIPTPIPPLSSALLILLMNEGNGFSIGDTSGNANNSIAIKTTWTTVGRTALTFSTAGALVTTPIVKHNSVRTYAVWTRRTGPGGGNFGRIFDKRTSGAEVELLYNDESAGTYRFARLWSGGGGSWTIRQPKLNEWHHIAVTYDSSSTANNPIMYVDGVSQIVTRLSMPSGTVNTNIDPYVIGNRGTGDRWWGGDLNDFIVYDSAIVDIKSLM